uniref:Uncharacterized protein n=1 Tax=Arundo donax TaxID=35708 RepID=A0A0A9FKA3_ARUDO
MCLFMKIQEKMPFHETCMWFHRFPTFQLNGVKSNYVLCIKILWLRASPIIQPTSCPLD